MLLEHSIFLPNEQLPGHQMYLFLTSLLTNNQWSMQACVAKQMCSQVPGPVDYECNLPLSLFLYPLHIRKCYACTTMFKST